MLISQVSGNQSLDTPTLVSNRLPCLCPPCCKNVNEMMEKCEYKNEGTSQEHPIIMKGGVPDNTVDDPHGIILLTVAQLRVELLDRGLRRTGHKPELVE